LSFETHAEIERAVFDGMGDRVHDLAMNFWVSPPKTVVLLLD
jgi:catechol-2,3-dioxygenase